MDDERSQDEEVADMQAEDADMRRLQEEIRNLPVADHIEYMMHSLSSLAVERLGLSGEEPPRRDLDQARLAIDGFKALLDVVEKAQPARVGAHRSMLSQLRFAYVAALDECPAADTAAPGNEPENDAPADPSGEAVSPEE
jgi:hypothetical protein